MSDGRPVIVTGMHRSGTSAIARVVNLLGVDLGPEDRLLEPKEDNPDGFWENRDIVQLHDDLLAQLSGRWDDPPLSRTLTEVTGYDRFLTEAREIVSSFQGGRPGFKDPRAALLLGLWATVWPEAQVVVVVRQPSAVARSLARREGFEDEKSLSLWARYTCDALSTSKDPIVIRFEDLLSDTESVVRRLAGSLTLEPSDAMVLAAIETIRAPSSNVVEDEPGGAAGRLASWLYDQIDGLPSTVLDVVAAGLREPATVSRLQTTEADLRKVLRMSDDFHEELRRTQLVAEKRQEALDREEKAREELARRLNSAEPEMERLRKEVAWRRAIQYRFEKVLGRRGMRLLSGYREDT